MAGSTNVNPHTAPVGNPDGLAEAQAAMAAGMAAAEQRYGHYEAKVHGQGAAAGDLMPAESTLQSVPNPPNARSTL